MNSASNHPQFSTQIGEGVFLELVDNAPFGMYIVDSQFRLRAINKTAAAAFGEATSLIGRDLSEILRAKWAEPGSSAAIERFRHTLATGEPHRAPHDHGPRKHGARVESYNWQIGRVTLSDGTFGVVCYFFDLTSIREADLAIAAVAERDAFLLELNDRLRPLEDPIEIQSAAVRVLGEHLEADWVHFVEFDESLTFGTIRCDYINGSAPSLLGRHPQGDYDLALKAMQAGRTVAEEDLETSALATTNGRMAYVSAGLHAYAAAPIVRGGRLLAAVGVADRRVRSWTPQEIVLIEATAERTWTYVERALAERSLANDLRDTRLLQRLSAQLIEEQGSTSLYETLIDAAMSIMRSDFASLQTVRPVQGEAEGALDLIASRGFSAEMALGWESRDSDASTTCSAAVRTGARVVVPDIDACDFMAGTEDGAAYLKAGIRAVQTTPLVSRRGRTLGLISTHWAAPHQPTERDLRLLDLLARQAADLLERTQAEEALRRSEQELKEADRRKDEFLAMLAHELRNPLAPLRTSLELIRLAGDTPGAVESVRTMLEEQVAQMVRLIDDLLDVSRITSGKIRLRRQPTALASLVNVATESNRAALSAGQVSLSVDIPDEPILLDVDPPRFVQVLSNVLHNAVKFTDKGGSIRISASLRSPADGDVVLVVTDSGAGISQDLLPRVFDLFAQDDASESRSHAGLGIGLALARRLIEMHGGSIEGHSDGPGLGSTFTIRVPVSREAPREEAPSPAPTSVTVPMNRRVVVIDDNVYAATAMQRLVTALGGECRVAHDGTVGLAQVREFRPDMVFLDIGMPGIDGYETCRRIRQELGSEILVVAMTGWGQDRDKQQAARAGFDLHLTKPADPTTLKTLLSDPASHQLLKSRQAGRG